jgi:hypothetical protein
MVHNNPVALANSERKRIWKSSSGNVRTDIILSIGTGVQYLSPQTNGNVLRDIPIKKKKAVKLLPGSWKQKLITSYDVVMSTLSCEDAWTKFVNSTNGDFNPSILHRLNVQLESKPAKLDQVAKIRLLQDQVRSYFNEKQSLKSKKPYLFHKSYSSGRGHVKAVAQRLTASLFYFEEEKLGSELPAAETSKRLPRICKGILCCRLSPSMRNQLSSLMAKTPEFRVNEQDGLKVFIVPRPTLNLETFSTKVEFPITGDSWKIEMRFPDQWGKDHWEAISGFS